MTTQVNTQKQYEEAIAGCRDVFSKKTEDYGTAWRVYRPISVADQIYIKAHRIRTIQETGVQKIGDHITDEFRGIVNYAIIGLIQLTLQTPGPEDLPATRALELYDQQVGLAFELMERKNHDYGEAWRNMSLESFTDLILSKVLRIRQIIRNGGKTLMSEGIDANFFDILNYAVFALILETQTS